MVWSDLDVDGVLGVVGDLGTGFALRLGVSWFDGDRITSNSPPRVGDGRSCSAPVFMACFRGVEVGEMCEGRGLKPVVIRGESVGDLGRGLTFRLGVRCVGEGGPLAISLPRVARELECTTPAEVDRVSGDEVEEGLMSIGVITVPVVNGWLLFVVVEDVL